MADERRSDLVPSFTQPKIRHVSKTSAFVVIGSEPVAGHVVQQATSAVVQAGSSPAGDIPEHLTLQRGQIGDHAIVYTPRPHRDHQADDKQASGRLRAKLQYPADGFEIKMRLWHSFDSITVGSLNSEFSCAVCLPSLCRMRAPSTTASCNIAAPRRRRHRSQLISSAQQALRGIDHRKPAIAPGRPQDELTVCRFQQPPDKHAGWPASNIIFRR